MGSPWRHVFSEKSGAPFYCLLELSTVCGAFLIVFPL
ncbi:unnamed protein product [Chondrus crispus]|uniref:Uncharacterized protein n=1 Tax=Chondrus crispus TaxID=2769 RepID=R7Q230_CHOCR|nr:unnamed protein product [Chondrus crispus]CDF32109.1 unnamed protein product [Chondrus crispus]|eukprot:XP_005711774.1 unnamed protein product [Chondrus crispus]